MYPRPTPQAILSDPKLSSEVRMHEALDARKVVAYGVAWLANPPTCCAWSYGWTRSLRAFGAWLFGSHRSPVDRLAHLPLLNVRTDRRHVRRALTFEEVECLYARAVAATGTGGNSRESACAPICALLPAFSGDSGPSREAGCDTPKTNEGKPHQELACAALEYPHGDLNPGPETENLVS